MIIKSYFKGQIEAKKSTNHKYIGTIIGTNDSTGDIKNCHYCGKSEYPLISKKEGTKENVSSNEKLEEINKRLVANEI